MTTDEGDEFTVFVWVGIGGEIYYKGRCEQGGLFFPLAAGDLGLAVDFPVFRQG